MRSLISHIQSFVATLQWKMLKSLSHLDLRLTGNCWQEPKKGEKAEFDPSSLKPNWADATGRLYHHIDVVKLSFPDKTEAQVKDLANSIYDSMKEFRDFNHRDFFANVKYVVKKKDGKDTAYAGFGTSNTSGFLARRISGNGEELRNWVELRTGTLANGTKVISAVTLGDHVLVGVRLWYIKATGKDIVIGTETFDQRHGPLADKGFMGPDWDLTNVTADGKGFSVAIKGASDTEKVWRAYLTNVDDIATKQQTIGSYKLANEPHSNFPSVITDGKRKMVVGLQPGLFDNESLQDAMKGKIPSA
jgi:hypothetical protein